ncbi:hypothetical protein BDR26DRAFT_877450 [Obelidium mucronatum]|nr:hypothetical protein BDR26DRAFT_877450 [Obelidium mucronatum]
MESESDFDSIVMTSSPAPIAGERFPASPRRQVRVRTASPSEPPTSPQIQPQSHEPIVEALGRSTQLPLRPAATVVDDLDSTPPPLPPTIGLFNFKLEMKLLDYTSQTTTGINKGTHDVVVSSVAEFLEFLFSKTKTLIEREVIDTDGVYSFGKEKQDVLLADLDRFAILTPPSSAKGVKKKPSSVTTAMMQNWKDKTVTFAVLKYSVTSSGKPVFLKIKKAVLDFAAADRAGAATESLHRDTVARLKELHSMNYATHEANWGIFANYCLADGAQHLEQRVNSAPPLHLMQLFRRAASASDHQNLVNIQANAVALNASTRNIVNMERVLVGMKRTRNSLDADIHSLEAVIHDAKIVRVVIQDQSHALSPTETEESRRYFARIGEQEDIDHADPSEITE